MYRAVKPEAPQTEQVNDQQMADEGENDIVQPRDDEEMDLAAQYEADIRKANAIMRSKYETGGSTEHGA